MGTGNAAATAARGEGSSDGGKGGATGLSRWQWAVMAEVVAGLGSVQKRSMDWVRDLGVGDFAELVVVSGSKEKEKEEKRR